MHNKILYHKTMAYDLKGKKILYKNLLIMIYDHLCLNWLVFVTSTDNNSSNNDFIKLSPIFVVDLENPRVSVCEEISRGQSLCNPH